MSRITFLPHTADIRMHLEAATPEELLQLALRGMNSILYIGEMPTTEADPVTFVVQITSLDKTTLLIDFLSEVLSESFAQKAIFHTLNITALGDTTLDALLHGHHVARFDEDIKAVTYHEAEVKQNARGHWETIVIFDI